MEHLVQLHFISLPKNLGLYLPSYFIPCSLPLQLLNSFSFIWLRLCEYFLSLHLPFSDWLSLAQFYVWGNWIIGMRPHRKGHSRFENLSSASWDHAFLHFATDQETKLRLSLILPYVHSIVSTGLVSLTEFLYLNSLFAFLRCDLKFQAPNSALRVRQGNSSMRIGYI